MSKYRENLACLVYCVGCFAGLCLGSEFDQPPDLGRWNLDYPTTESPASLRPAAIIDPQIWSMLGMPVLQISSHSAPPASRHTHRPGACPPWSLTLRTSWICSTDCLLVCAHLGMYLAAGSGQWNLDAGITRFLGYFCPTNLDSGRTWARLYFKYHRTSFLLRASC